MFECACGRRWQAAAGCLRCPPGTTREARRMMVPGGDERSPGPSAAVDRSETLSNAQASPAACGLA